MNQSEGEPAPQRLIFILSAFGVVLAALAIGSARLMTATWEAGWTSYDVKDVELDFAIESVLAIFFLAAGECMRRSRCRRLRAAISATDMNT